MKYYKIIDKSTFKGIGSSSNFRRVQKKHGILLSCNEDNAEYIQIGEKLYHDTWLLPVQTDRIAYEDAQIIAIENEEYELLHTAAQTGEEASTSLPEPEEITELIVEPDLTEMVTIEYVRQQKLKELAKAYSEAIAKGVDVTLSSGTTIHYTLTPQDQLNLIALTDLANAGEKNLPYTAEEIQAIAEAANQYKIKQSSYFIALRSYVESLTDLNEIAAVTYEMKL